MLNGLGIEYRLRLKKSVTMEVWRANGGSVCG
jgi:hypothetical protein